MNKKGLKTMATNQTDLIVQMTELVELGQLELIEQNILDDGTVEKVYEPKDDAGRVSLIKLYCLPMEGDEQPKS
jgi:hypothetical protein